MMNKIIKIGLVVLSVVILAVLPVSADTNLEGFLNGINFYYTGQYEEAIDSLSSYLDGESGSVEALYYRALARLELKNILAAKKDMNQLMELGYEYAHLHWKLGNLYLNKDSGFDSPFYNEAKNELVKANQLGINSPSFHSDLAMAYQGLGNMEKAAEEYELALKNGGEVADYINLATVYKDVHRLEKAIKYYSKALELSPNNTAVYLNLGNIFINQGNYEQAIKLLEKGSEINPNFVAIKSKLALAYLESGDKEKAQETFKEVVSQNSNYYEAYYYLGKINEEEEKIEKAIYYFGEAIKNNPNYVKAYIALGNLYLKKQDTYKAMANYMTALEKNPNYPDAHFQLALAYKELNMKDAAINELRVTLHLDSSNRAARELLDELTGK